MIVIEDNYMHEDFSKELASCYDRYIHWELLPHTSESCAKNTPDTNWNVQVQKRLWDRYRGILCEDFWHVTTPLIQKIDANLFTKVKANITFCGSEVQDHTWHCDSTNPVPYSRVGIYYLNSTDGPTRVEKPDGEIVEVECVENRFVTFPIEWLHTGTVHTNAKTRKVMNFNYLPK